MSEYLFFGLAEFKNSHKQLTFIAQRKCCLEAKRPQPHGYWDVTLTARPRPEKRMVKRGSSRSEVIARYLEIAVH